MNNEATVNVPKVDTTFWKGFYEGKIQAYELILSQIDNSVRVDTLIALIEANRRDRAALEAKR